MKEFIYRYYSNILFRNSLYPMLATAVAAFFGFFFWIFSARLFSVEEVGLAATLVSTVSMLGIFSLIGYDSSIVRFLSHEKKKNITISTGFATIALFSIFLSELFLLTVQVVAPDLAFITKSFFTVSLFILFTTMTALNTYAEAVFLAYRHTFYTFIVTILFSVVKVALPFAFIGYGAFGIFVAASVSQVIGFVISVGILMKKFGYHPCLTLDTTVIARFWKYSAGNYVADIFSFIPMALLPILITNTLGAEQVAYYYVAMTIAGFLYVIPASTMRSLFAEGSFDIKSIPKNIRESLKTTALFLIPLILILLVLGSRILEIFGSSYATSGKTFLMIAVLNSLLVSVSVLYGSLFRLSNSITSLLVRNITYAGGTLLLGYLLLPYGLLGVGLALVGGNALAILASVFSYHKNMSASFEKMRTFSFKNLPTRIRTRINEYYIWPFKTIISAKLAYYHARRQVGYVPKTVLFYPEAPKTYHTLYKICHFLGWKITTNPKSKSDVQIFFEDMTYRNSYPILTSLHQKHPVINFACTDISKKHVDDVFKEVFGYHMSVDPRTHKGICVRKSNINAVHDGKIVQCPLEPEEGFVYQKLIETINEKNMAVDLRINIFNNTIPVVHERFKNADDIFNITVDASFVETDDVLSADEQEKVLTFCKKMGLDYGEIDALRSKEDGRLYIVDVNNTPAGPLGPLYKNNTDLQKWFIEVARATKKEFLA